MCHYDKSHTAEHLHDELLRVGNCKIKWYVFTNVIAVTMDNNASIRSTIKLTECQCVGCLAHIPNLMSKSEFDRIARLP